MCLTKYTCDTLFIVCPYCVIAEMTVVVCDKAAKAQLLLDKASNLKSLKRLIIMDEISDKNRETAAKQGIKLIPFRDVVVR